MTNLGLPSSSILGRGGIGGLWNWRACIPLFPLASTTSSGRPCFGLGAVGARELTSECFTSSSSCAPLELDRGSRTRAFRDMPASILDARQQIRGVSPEKKECELSAMLRGSLLRGLCFFTSGSWLSFGRRVNGWVNPRNRTRHGIASYPQDGKTRPPYTWRMGQLLAPGSQQQRSSPQPSWFPQKVGFFFWRSSYCSLSKILQISIILIL